MAHVPVVGRIEPDRDDHCAARRWGIDELGVLECDREASIRTIPWTAPAALTEFSTRVATSAEFAGSLGEGRAGSSGSPG